MAVPHTQQLAQCAERMASIEKAIESELTHLNQRLEAFDAFLSGRITETRDWISSISKKIDGNGATGYEARLRCLEVLVAENAKAIKELAETVKEGRQEAGKYKQIIAGAVIQFLITSLAGGGLVYALWEKGLLVK